MPHSNILVTPTGVSVGASAVDTELTRPFHPVSPLYANVNVVISAITEATGITFSLKDSFDNGANYSAVGSESSVAITKKTVTAGTKEITEVTWPAHSAAANGDYLHATGHGGTTYAAYLNKRALEVQTLTYDDAAGSTHQDFVIVEDAAGLSYAVALTKPVAAVDTVNFADIGSTGASDYFAFYDAAGLQWAAAADISGSDLEPTGAIWTAIPAGRKCQVDISGVTDDEDIAALFETDLNALTGFSAAFTTDDSAGDGTMTITRDAKGLTLASVAKNADDSGAGSIAVSTTTAGVTSEGPSGPLWTAVDASRRGLADISGDTTAAQVAARAETAWNLLTGFTAAITSDDSAANGTMTFTQVASGPVEDPVPKNAAEDGAGSITGVETTEGITTNDVPTGALYLAADEQIPINIEPGYTAAQVATAARAALVANAAFAADFTSSAVVTATITHTQTAGGTVADMAPKREDDGAAGSVVTNTTAAGSNGGVVLATNKMTSTTHNFVTGDRIVLSGADVPLPFVTDTTYYVIKDDANTLQLAETQALALAGTEVDITDYGSGTVTLYKADYNIRMLVEDSSDAAQLPLQDTLKVVANSGSGDSCTVSAVWSTVKG